MSPDVVDAASPAVGSTAGRGAAPLATRGPRGSLLRRLPGPVASWVAAVLCRVLAREVMTFLTVGGAGYVVDVAVFNWLRSVGPTDALDPSVARTLAVMVAMCVTYAGNRGLTWKGHGSRSRRREVTLFAVSNVIGFGFSVVCLLVSHDVLGLTSRLADNLSANVVGLALGTAFRFLSYKYVVFAGPGKDEGFPGPRG